MKKQVTKKVAKKISKTLQKKQFKKLDKKPELLAPVSNFAMLNSAINSGADAIYFGVGKQNMRAAAGNFTLAEIKKIVTISHKNKVKCYLALNSIVFDSEKKHVEQILREAKKAKVDAVIAWDFLVISLAKKLKIPLHISTQASIANSEAASFFKKLGAKRIVLARELNLNQIKEIKKNTQNKLELEVFVHGAMCVSISGRCFLSQFTFNKSANRGECIQPCRRSYTLNDKEEHFEYELGNDYLLSPKDLSTILFIDKLIEAKIDSFKIEGRQKSAEYVAVVVKAYRSAIDAYFEGKLTEDLKQKLEAEIKKVYNRGFSEGFYLGKPISAWANSYGSNATEKKVHAGKVVNFYKKPSVVEIKIEADCKINLGDEIYIIGPTTGTVRHKINIMLWNDKLLTCAKQGESFTMKLVGIVRKNDAVYLIKMNQEI